MSLNRGTYGSQPTQPSYTFKPEENITAYELAQLLPFLLAAWTNPIDVYSVKRGELPSGTNLEQLPESLHRHFQKR